MPLSRKGRRKKKQKRKQALHLFKEEDLPQAKGGDNVLIQRRPASSQTKELTSSPFTPKDTQAKESRPLVKKISWGESVINEDNVSISKGTRKEEKGL